MKRKLLIFLFLVCCFAGFVVEKSYALSLVYLTFPVSSGTMYSFTLNNDGSTLGNIFELYIQMPVPVDELDPLGFGSPVGWGDNGVAEAALSYGSESDPDRSYVDWWSDIGSELPPLSSLSGFSITSDGVLSGDILFSVMADEWAGATVFENAQFQQSQVAIPEPSTFLMCVLGLLLAAQQKKYKKKL